ncbi:unnamed protein product, partial [Trichogramma brassicae]
MEVRSRLQQQQQLKIVVDIRAVYVLHYIYLHSRYFSFDFDVLYVPRFTKVASRGSSFTRAIIDSSPPRRLASPLRITSHSSHNNMIIMVPPSAIDVKHLYSRLVSLWGGDASFQNLDLRLEVLEEQLNLPFTFVSGHIHELLIHVPWVKITSEPIVVTINTIARIINFVEITKLTRGKPSVSELLERCPAVSLDYVHYAEIPEDVTPQQLAELSSGFEYSNFREERHIRYTFGDITLRVCSGLLHRIDTIRQAAEKYDYNPYIVPKTLPKFDELPPVTVEEYEALRENIPILTTDLYVKKVAVQLQLADHYSAGLPRQRSLVKQQPQQQYDETLAPSLSEEPHVSLEAGAITASLEEPIYPFRLIACASKQTEIPAEMLTRCYRKLKFQLNGVGSQVFLKSERRRTSIVLPCYVEGNLRTILYPDYWKEAHRIHSSHELSVDSITITGTKRKIMVAVAIVSSLLSARDDDLGQLVACSSICNDSCDEKSPIYLELCLESIQQKGVASLCTRSYTAELASMKIFAHSETEQAFILSGPEHEEAHRYGPSNEAFSLSIIDFFVFFCYSNREIQPLISAIVQFSNDLVDNPQHPTILSFRVAPMKACLDPLLLKWLDYQVNKGKCAYSAPRNIGGGRPEQNPTQVGTESIVSDPSVTKKRSSFVHESVHSSSDKDKRKVDEAVVDNKSAKKSTTKTYDSDAVLTQSESLQQKQQRQNQQQEQHEQGASSTNSSSGLWARLTRLSPWWSTLILDARVDHTTVYVPTRTMSGIDLEATLDLVTKSTSATEPTTAISESATLSLCLYIDTSPIVVSLNEEQVSFLHALTNDIASVTIAAGPASQTHSSSIGEARDSKDLPAALRRSSSSPTQQQYLEDATTTSTMSAVKKENTTQAVDASHVSACIQWTIAKISVKLYVLAEDNDDYAKSKLALELEDIITSIDVQPVYFKLKHKITTATIFHYARYRRRAYITNNNPMICDLLNNTLLVDRRNRSNGTWKDSRMEVLQPSDTYITEALVKIQPIDLTVPPSVLGKYVGIARPLLLSSDAASCCESRASDDDKKIMPPFIGIAKLRSESLPLVYFDLKGLRIMLPTTMDDADNDSTHDLLMLQVDGVRITPHAENPICRVPLRPDIYQLAGQANILNVPGSAVEDRQYQINVDGISAFTTTWKGYQRSVMKRVSQSYLYTMNENPAVEWNKLGNGSSLEPHLPTLPIVTRFDFCFIVAPVIIFKPDTIVCASAAELNCLTDLELMFNPGQIKLVAWLMNQLQGLVPSGGGKSDRSDIFETPRSQLRNQPSYMSGLKGSHLIKQTIPEFELDVAKDSGFSCFDVSLLLGNEEGKRSTSIPSAGDFTTFILETKSGEAHLDTGIPPSFLVVKWDACKNSQMSVNMGRPTKCHFSLARLDKLLRIRDQLVDCLDDGRAHTVVGADDRCNVPNNSTSSSPDSGSSAQQQQHQVSSSKYRVPDTNLSTKQLVFSLETSDGTSELLMSLASFSASASNSWRPERIFGSFSWDSLVVSIRDLSRANGSAQKATTMLLNPCSCSVSVCLLWEPWQQKAEPPQIQVQAECDCLHLDLGPRHILACQSGLGDLTKILSRTTEANSNQHQQQQHEKPRRPTRHEQHYQDDLKSGAFQFVDGTTEELPFPYQVVFHSQPQRAMAWRYPHPRTLTRIHVSPVPMEEASSSETGSGDDDDDEPGQRLGCAIEYWSESQTTYQRYVDFYLSEQESYRLDLPEHAPLQAVACVWRIVLLNGASSRSSSRRRLSSKALLACLRIDSYFNPRIVPSLQAAVSLGCVQLRLFNQLEDEDEEEEQKKPGGLLPAPLARYELAGQVPANQCFAVLELSRAQLALSRWSSTEVALVRANAALGLRLLDYGLLLSHEVVEPAEWQLRLSRGPSPDLSLDLSLACEPFDVRLSPASFHALSLAAQLWAARLLSSPAATKAAPTTLRPLTTRYVVANDTNVPLRFGQDATNDSIMLESGQCHFYSWRHATNQALKVGMEDANGWHWSKPFSIKEDACFDLELAGSVEQPSCVLSCRVSALSASQKLVTFSAQFVVSNQLQDGFEMRLIKYDAQGKSRASLYPESFFLAPRSRPASIVLADPTNVAMRLRFSSVPNLAWTGDIPLQPNARWGQPWLVKVPLQERGQFISIWVRMITETIDGVVKILQIRSVGVGSVRAAVVRLGRSAQVLQASRQGEHQGHPGGARGLRQGRGGRVALLPARRRRGRVVPVGGRRPAADPRPGQVRGRRPGVEHAAARAAALVLRGQLAGLRGVDSGPAATAAAAAGRAVSRAASRHRRAPQTGGQLLPGRAPGRHLFHVRGPAVRSARVEPELLQASSAGIHSAGGQSQSLRRLFFQCKCVKKIALSTLFKHNSFVLSFSQLTQISIHSSLHKDMRVLRIGSNYVIGNMTGHDFWAVALAVPASARNLQLHDHASTDKSIKISAATERRYAVPIVQWHKISDATDGPFVFYVALRLTENKWSCPIRVDQGLARRCIALPKGRESLPLVVTTQEDKGTVYVTIHEDKQPQLLIDNVCPYGIVVGQSDQERDNVIPDAEHFDWKCCIESKSSCYYSMPSVGSNLPDLPISSEATSASMLVAGLVDDSGSIQWSKSVELSDKLSDHLLRLPARGDVKISTRAQCYTIRVRFSPVSQYEISAQDIRSKIERKSNLQRASSPEPSQQQQHDNNNAWLTADLDNRVNSQCSSASNATTYVSAQDDDAEAAAARPTSSSGNNNDDEDDEDDYTRNTSSSPSHASATLHFRGISFVLMKDVNEQGQRIEVLSLSTTDTILQLERDSRGGESQVSLHVGDLQLDNQMFEAGGYDFPVVLVSQRPLVRKDNNTAPPVYLSSTSPKKNLEDIVDNCLLGVQLSLQEGVYKEIAVKLAPVSAYVEGAFVTLLMDFVTATLPACVSSTSSGQQQQQQANARSSEKNSRHSIAVPLPDHVLVDARILSQPLRLQSFLIEPVSILLSVHTSVHLYVAFDHSPLFFEAFDKRNLVTTPYRLGNALAMHYLSGAIFGVGWVVGSLEILGSLGGLAQALGSGLKDFVSLPFQGLLQGPWGFVVGVTHGSASLVKHVTAGTVNSVTKLASSVARNLDRLTLDEEHLQRQEEFRRTRPQGVAQGLYQGLSGLGMSLLAAVAGLAHHPLQQVWSGEASTRGLVSGVGRGLVGVVTKPLSGAAELVALTGQGLLQGTGWSSLPEPRQRAVIQYPTERTAESSSCLRYAWRLMPLLQANQDNILYVCQAERVLQQQVSSDKHPVSLVLTRQMLLIVSLAEDSLEKVLPIKDLLMSSSEHEPTQLRLYYSTAATVAAATAAAAAAAAATRQLEQSNHSRPGSPLETSAPIHMDREIRARVAEFLRTSSAGITSVSSNSDTASENCEASTLPDPDNCYTFHLSADSRAYFIALLSLLRRQCRGHGFAV